MRPSTIVHRVAPSRRWSALLACLAMACLALAMTSAPALAKGEKNPDEILHKEDFLKFQNCPMEVAKACLYGETLEGEFKLGSKTTQIVNPVILQGGLPFLGTLTVPLLAPRFGAEEASKTPQPVPGGLTGISELIGGPVNATAERAGTIEVTPTNLGFGRNIAVVFPIKIHLENENLGPNCYIGSDAEPVVLHLTDATTEPPEGVEPISGKVGTNKGIDKSRIAAFYNNTLVDNTFPVPAATGCGEGLLETVLTAAVNAGIGLPSPAGTSKAVLTGNQFTALSTWVSKYDKKAIKAKEKELAGKG
jgi:hypothetical protein